MAVTGAGAALTGAGVAGTGAGVAGIGAGVAARVRLAALPTPLVPAPRLAEVVGVGALYVKRDDLTGFAFAGNKARPLEFLLAAALGEGADTLVTGGAPGSNFCAAAAAGAGGGGGAGRTGLRARDRRAPGTAGAGPGSGPLLGRRDPLDRCPGAGQ